MADGSAPTCRSLRRWSGRSTEPTRSGSTRSRSSATTRRPGAGDRHRPGTSRRSGPASPSWGWVRSRSTRRISSTWPAPDPTFVRQKSVEVLLSELLRRPTYGARFVNVHSGSHRGIDAAHGHRPPRGRRRPRPRRGRRRSGCRDPRPRELGRQRRRAGLLDRGDGARSSTRSRPAGSRSGASRSASIPPTCGAPATRSRILPSVDRARRRGRPADRPRPPGDDPLQRLARPSSARGPIATSTSARAGSVRPGWAPWSEPPAADVA